jgi:hypothetical protein
VKGSSSDPERVLRHSSMPGREHSCFVKRHLWSSVTAFRTSASACFETKAYADPGFITKASFSCTSRCKVSVGSPVPGRSPHSDCSWPSVHHVMATYSKTPKRSQHELPTRQYSSKKFKFNTFNFNSTSNRYEIAPRWLP